MIEFHPDGLGRAPVRVHLRKSLRRALPPKHARQAINKARRLAMRPVANIQLNGVDQDAALGFSLKPSKKLKKAVTKAVKQVKHVATLKNAIKVAAVGGALLAAPVVLPALAHGAVASGGLLLKGARGAAGGLVKVFRGKGKAAPKTEPGPTQDVFEKAIPDLPASSGPAAPSTPTAPPPLATSPTEAAAAPTPGGDGVAMPSASAAPAAADASATDEAPKAAGFSGGSLPMLALAAAGLFMLSRSPGPRRRRR